MVKGGAVILIVLFCILLSGCSIIDSIIGKDKPLKVTNIHTGSEGLKMTFLEDQPLSLYRVGEAPAPIIIGLNLENKGATALLEDTTIAVNTDDNYIVLDKDRANVVLMGKTQERPLAGDEETVTFTGMIQPIGIDEDETVIDVAACYRYSVEGQFDVCIDTDPSNLRKGIKGCSSDQNSISSSGQGGPVGASKIDVVLNEGADSVKPQFIIHVRNFGNGVVFDAFKSPIELCSSALKDASSLNVVFTRATLAGVEFKCQPNPIVLSEEDENNYVLCSNDGFSVSTSVSSYESSLVVYMVYNYVDSESKKITIKDIKTTN